MNHSGGFKELDAWFIFDGVVVKGPFTLSQVKMKFGLSNLLISGPAFKRWYPLSVFYQVLRSINSNSEIVATPHEDLFFKHLSELTKYAPRTKPLKKTVVPPVQPKIAFTKKEPTPPSQNWNVTPLDRDHLFQPASQAHRSVPFRLWPHRHPWQCFIDWNFKFETLVRDLSWYQFADYRLLNYADESATSVPGLRFFRLRWISCKALSKQLVCREGWLSMLSVFATNALIFLPGVGAMTLQWRMNVVLQKKLLAHAKI